MSTEAERIGKFRAFMKSKKSHGGGPPAPPAPPLGHGGGPPAPPAGSSGGATLLYPPAAGSGAGGGGGHCRTSIYELGNERLAPFSAITTADQQLYLPESYQVSWQ